MTTLIPGTGRVHWVGTGMSTGSGLGLVCAGAKVVVAQLPWPVPSAEALVEALLEQVTARTRLASSPVVFYAGLFVCIDIAFNVFEREVLARADATQVSERLRRMARRRATMSVARAISNTARRLS